MAQSAAKDLEAWMPRLVRAWRNRTRQKGGDQLNAQELDQVAAGVKRLSHGLTRERELAGARYMDDPQLLAAYLFFFWPVSYAQARSALGELNRPRRVLDLGSGPGPVAFAALDAGASEVTCAERSAPALDLARALAVEAEVGLSTRDWSADKPLPPGPFDLITLGHVVNELHGVGPDAIAKRAAFLAQVARNLTPSGTLLVLEPALRETSRALLEVRDVLVAQGFAVRAPCLFKGPCPALVKPSDWCHAERSWTKPGLVDALARRTNLHKDALKMSYLALAAPKVAWPEPPAGRVFRIVSEPLEGKGRQRLMGCGPEGRLGLALQDKHRTAANQAFFSLERGAVVRLDHTEPKGDGVALDDRTTVEVLARAGQAVTGP
ncbi:MAG: small ribosomal subunit Rsm22 family protein [Myxococcaceae bacterium]|nr:small ribosomal subunit Rsm22 family protein [Myxococcaceae bacterium]